MKLITLNPSPFPKSQLLKKLEEYDIFINRYAEEFFAHPGFQTEKAETIVITIASLEEIGLENGAALDEIFLQIKRVGLKPCPANTGLFLRFAYKDQPQSKNSILSGTHEAPDQAVTVLSELLEQNDGFPKGLYLRNVDGRCWLRAYICSPEYKFPGDALFAFQLVSPEEFCTVSSI